MTIEQQKTDLISRIAYYREELDRLGQSRLALGREARTLLLNLVAALEEELSELSASLPARSSLLHVYSN